MTPEEARAAIPGIMGQIEQPDVPPLVRQELVDLWWSLRKVAGLEVTSRAVSIYLDYAPMNGDMTWPPQNWTQQWPPGYFQGTWPWSGERCPKPTVLPPPVRRF